MASAGEVVALAEAAVDLAEFRLVAQALVAAALPAPAAQLLALGLPAGTQVHAAGFALLALAAGAQVARLTLAHPAVVRACMGGTLISLPCLTLKGPACYIFPQKVMVQN